MVRGRRRQGTHLAWALQQGEWPRAYIDVIDADPTNLRADNLRPATRSQWSASRRASRGSTSRFAGVSWWNHRGRWRAEIRKEGKHTFLGYFKSEADAAQAYDAAARKLHGEFARPNFMTPSEAARYGVAPESHGEAH